MLVLTTARAIRHAATCPQSAPESRFLHYAALRGRPFADPEFVTLHGGWFEAVFILSDDGFGHVVFVPDQPDTDPEILKLCRAEL